MATEAKGKHYLLHTLVLAAVVAVGLLVVAPQAQAQQVAPITVDKECSPNPVRVGQPLTCTIDVGPAYPAAFEALQVIDTFPASVTVTGATRQQFLNGVEVATLPCTVVTGNTVSCPVGIAAGANSGQGTLTLRVTIDAIAQQCGTFTNTAEAETAFKGTFTASADFTVDGCQGPPSPSPPPSSSPPPSHHHKHHHKQSPKHKGGGGGISQGSSQSAG